MNKDQFNQILHFDIDKFVRNNKSLSDEALLLKYHDSEIPIIPIVEQLKARRTLKNKIPSFLHKGLIFTKRAAEQCSSEFTANYKADLVSGERFVDLTAGLGIDFYFMYQNFEECYYCEQDPDLFEISSYNFEKLMVNAELSCSSGINFIKKFKDHYFDCIYLDPDRRPEEKKRISLSAYEPNVKEIISLLMKKASKVLIKLSPMLDIHYLRKQLKDLREIHVISVDNECKELLAIFYPDEGQEFKMTSVSINSKKNAEFILSKREAEVYNRITSPKVLNYFYDPDLALLKSRLTEKFAYKNDILFLNNISDYLCSDKLIRDFPGRAFKVIDVIPYKKKTLKNYLQINRIRKANVAKRGFPDSVDFIRKIYQIKDGGQSYLFFTELEDKSLVCIHGELL